MLAKRGKRKTVCPSEVARELAGPSGDWQKRMSDVHAAVDDLLNEGKVLISWKGEALDERRGPYRISRPAN
ncbi:DUF3253 domain-containing protein [Altererythrobacter aurantiacus]|uniref:DUF3253 domain-containing protein n=2 Tax=Parapontixanthobacter aurantiacus TaxID=1463599 RepID=A0A844ZJR3_9SPHN|nr:DUF3253 domain-containing protein [Parapontixanthobacter aurantiacus]